MPERKWKHGEECSCSACIRQQDYKKRLNTPTSWKLLKSRYPGTCSVCSTPFEVDDYIYWHVGSKEVRCVEHVPEDVVIHRLQALNALKEKSQTLTAEPQGRVYSSSYKKHGDVIKFRSFRTPRKRSKDL